MPLPPRPEIEKMTPATHGGPDEAEFRSAGLSANEILDFSVCANRYMTVPDMEEVMEGLAIDRLPDSEAIAFREALSGRLGVSTRPERWEPPTRHPSRASQAARPLPAALRNGAKNPRRQT